MACGDFQALQKFWGHAGVSRCRRLELFHALVVSRLLYGLSTVWLAQAQRRRLDGFYCRCLRRVLGIPAAFFSRVSNKQVFDKAGVLPLSDQVLMRQLILLGKAGRSPPDSLVRRCVFCDDSLTPQVGRFVRRVGRPRFDWASQVLKAGAAKFGCQRTFGTLLLRGSGALGDRAWCQELQRVFKS